MARAKKKRRTGEDAAIDLTPMIDVVFQMIIFFIVTANLDQQSILEEIKLAPAPHSIEQKQRPPDQVTIQVTKRGRYYVGGGAPYTLRGLEILLGNTVRSVGKEVPILIRGDMNTRHKSIRGAMDKCAAVDLYKIRFAGMKKKAE